MSKPKTPTTDTIRAWIDNSSFYEEFIPDEQDFVCKAVENSDLLTEIQDKIDGLIEEAYEEGQSDYEPEGVDEIPEALADTSFTVEKFKDCHTLEDFQREYSYIYSEYIKLMK